MFIVIFYSYGPARPAIMARSHLVPRPTSGRTGKFNSVVPHPFPVYYEMFHCIFAALLQPGEAA